MKVQSTTNYDLGRRAFLRDGSLWMAAAGLAGTASQVAQGSTENGTVLRIGLVTDMHYADKPSAGSRHYRESIEKLAEAASKFSEANPRFVVELGDFVDAASSVEAELGYLKRIQSEFVHVAKERHYVLGNHCVDTLTKKEFLDGVEQTESYSSFDRGEYHFIILDACFRSDGKPYERKNSKWDDSNIPPAEIEWLRADLQSTQRKTIVFTHQRLDDTKSHSVKNCAAVRQILEESKLVQAVFQGHSHQNDYRQILGIHYCTLRAMVEGAGAENNGYSLLNVHGNGMLQLVGYRQQVQRSWNV